MKACDRCGKAFGLFMRVYLGKFCEKCLNIELENLKK